MEVLASERTMRTSGVEPAVSEMVNSTADGSEKEDDEVETDGSAETLAVLEVVGSGLNFVDDSTDL